MLSETERAPGIERGFWSERTPGIGGGDGDRRSAGIEGTPRAGRTHGTGGAPKSAVDDGYLDTALAQLVEIGSLNAAVGDDAVDRLQIANLAEAAASEFRAVGQHDDLLRGV